MEEVAVIHHFHGNMIWGPNSILVVAMGLEALQ
jgi:hypothetical protein